MAKAKTEKGKSVANEVSTPIEMIPLSMNVSKDIMARLYKMKKAKGLPYEQDLIRIATVEMLERGGF